MIYLHIICHMHAVFRGSYCIANEHCDFVIQSLRYG